MKNNCMNSKSTYIYIYKIHLYIINMYIIDRYVKGLCVIDFMYIEQINF